MVNETAAYLAIFGMGLVTYMTRIGGLWLLSRVTLSPWMEQWLEHIPGAVIMSIVAPAVLASGLAEALAGAVTLGVAVFSRSLPLAMVAGVAAVWAARCFLA